MDPTAEATPEEAIPVLLRRTGCGVYALGLRLCGDPDGARDLVQETSAPDLGASVGWYVPLH